MLLNDRLLHLCLRQKCKNMQNYCLSYRQFSTKIICEIRQHILFQSRSVTSLNNVFSKRTFKLMKNDTGNFGQILNFSLLASKNLKKNGIGIIRKINQNVRTATDSSDNVNQSYESVKVDALNEHNPNDKLKIEECEGEQIHNDADKENNIRVNEINMQMLSKSLYEQIFKTKEQHSLTQEEINSIKENLKVYGIDTKDATRLPDVNLEIPSLHGENIEEHFYNIANEQIAPYVNILHDIISEIPEMPKNWVLKEGWTRYTEDTIDDVDHPLEPGLIFDVEVCVKAGPLPVLATAVSNKAWYGWVSKALIEESTEIFKNSSYAMDMLIPIESTKTDYGEKLNAFQKMPKIIVGHNVSYDRIRIKEQYWLNCTGTRFVDTMSLHVCVSGMNSYQRNILKTGQGKHRNAEFQCTSLNNLADVHYLYCGSKLGKQARDIFVEGNLSDIKKQFNMLMSYCASDVIATYNVLNKLYPLFEERFPHPATLAGMLELSCSYLPVNSNWQRYMEESESAYEDLNYEAKLLLTKRADATCRLMHDEKYKEDLWMWDQDWSTQTIKIKSLTRPIRKTIDEYMNKLKEEKYSNNFDKKYLTDDEEEEDPLEKQFSYLKATKFLLPVKMPHMPGYPAWYRKLCPKQSSEEWSPGPQNISTAMKIVPKLLNLTWENYPLHYIKEQGWGILVPFNDDSNIVTKIPLKQLLRMCPLPKQTCDEEESHCIENFLKDIEDSIHKTEFWNFKEKEDTKNSIYNGSGVWCRIEIDNCCYFFKLPHKDGENYNVGNPLARDFLSKFSENILAGLDASATKLLKIARTMSYWRNNRDRIMSQLVIWFDDQYISKNIRKTKKHMRYGAILPQIVVSGTLTRRAVEPTWMTASNAQVERIGSELRAMIQAPPGYNIVGADVDSQELWIASIIGDAYYKKVHGATPFGWMTLVGTKSNGTDMHSVTAKAVGISRDHAKIINYARIYGAGQKFAQRLLKQFNPSMTDVDALYKSKKMFSITKGQKVYRLKQTYINETLPDQFYSFSNAIKIAKLYRESLEELFDVSWVGGSESAMFNRLEEIASSSKPVTPFLKSRLSRALEGDIKDNYKYLPTKINWVVQSGAVDFLHLMLVSMRWLMKGNVRFCLSFHDEIRYLVASQYKYNAALAMHVTNLLTRCFCASRLGMKDLPMSVAFFSAVEVDTVLRKESSHDCKTPSNPHGLMNEYKIPNGESLDIWKALEKSGGSLGPWNKMKRLKPKTLSQ